MTARTITVLSAIGLAALLGACDTYSNVSVNCQLGVKNDGSHIAGCEFRNTGQSKASGCVKVHVSAPEGAENAFGQEEPANSWVSDTVCSGDVEPGEKTEPIELSFKDDSSEKVAQACTAKDDDGNPVFHCQFKIEEVPPGTE